MSKDRLNVGIVGCGFVVDYYMDTIFKYKQVNLVGVTDIINERSEKVSEHYKVPAFKSAKELIDKTDLDILINLTDPHNHFEVTKLAFDNGIHVYSEKPITMDIEEIRGLYKLADEKNLFLSTAPCNLLSPAAQTLLKAVKGGKIGQARVAYAEMDDGPVHLMNPERWKSKMGVSWPIKDEFEVGCTLEHIGYVSSWLIAMFGRVKEITAFSDCLDSNKCSGLIDPIDSPDFSIAILKHESGVVSRVTSGIMAPKNRSLQVVGDKGVLSVEDTWDNYCPVKFEEYTSLKLKAKRKTYISKNPLFRLLFGLRKKTITPIKRKRSLNPFHNNMEMDFCLGIANLADAILNNTKPTFDNEFSFHINEVSLHTQYALNKAAVKLSDGIKANKIKIS